MNRKSESKCQQFMNLAGCGQKKTNLSKIEILPRSEEQPDLEDKMTLEKGDQVKLLNPPNSAESTQRTSRNNYAIELKVCQKGEIIPEENEEKEKDIG